MKKVIYSLAIFSVVILLTQVQSQLGMSLAHKHHPNPYLENIKTSLGIKK